jgi:hypothetical protein
MTDEELRQLYDIYQLYGLLLQHNIICTQESEFVIRAGLEVLGNIRPEHLGALANFMYRYFSWESPMEE